MKAKRVASTKGKERIAVYPGSFDPITLGHVAVIQRAARIFDRVIVAVGVNVSKSACFGIDERLAILRHECRKLAHVEIASFGGLAAEFAKARGAVAIVRGLRTGDDFTHEMQMAMMNRQLANGIETILIPTYQEFSHISSTLVKEVASYGGDVSALVPPLVSRKLAEKFAET